MSAFTKDGIRVQFPDGLSVRDFDNRKAHRLLDRGMKAVDYIVDLPDSILFVEIKGPRDEEALKNMDGLYLARKFRDSFIYEWGEGRAGNRGRPIIYIVLVGLSEVSPPVLSQLTDQLQWWLPENGPSGEPWKRPLAAACMVMDLANWNRSKLTRTFPAVRVPA